MSPWGTWMGSSNPLPLSSTPPQRSPTPLSCVNGGLGRGVNAVRWCRCRCRWRRWGRRRRRRGHQGPGGRARGAVVAPVGLVQPPGDVPGPPGCPVRPSGSPLRWCSRVTASPCGVHQGACRARRGVSGGGQPPAPPFSPLGGLADRCGGCPTPSGGPAVGVEPPQGPLEVLWEVPHGPRGARRR